MSFQSTLLRCPACGTVFRAPTQMPAHGRVRCGVCSEVFAAQGAADDAAATQPHLHVPRPAYVSTAPTPLPSMGGSLLRGGLLLILLGMLAGQLIWLARNRLADLPRLYPLLATACERLGCQVPMYRDLKVIRVSDARVTSHPDYADALLAVVTLHNAAPLAQPWPRLELALTGDADVAVAERMFEPAEFLPAELQGETQFAPGATVELRLPLADPGTAAAGFRFSLH